MQLFLAHKTSEGNYILTEEEAHHCVRVLRHKVGDTVAVIDGEGNFFETRIEEISKKSVALSVLRQEEGWGVPPYHLTLALSPLRQRDRFEWAVEKSVELSVKTIQPIVGRRTVKPQVNISRLSRIVLSAMKQCKRADMPALNTELAFETWLDVQPKEGLRLLAYCEAETPISDFVQEIQQATQITFCIGPEGDFTAEEVDLAQQAGFHVVSLGQTRLRTETAALYSLAFVKSLKQF